MSFFFFNDTATTEIYTLSLHDALPIFREAAARASPGAEKDRPRVARPRGPHDGGCAPEPGAPPSPRGARSREDRKSTRLNSSHANISYAVFCLKKKK